MKSKFGAFQLLNNKNASLRISRLRNGEFTGVYCAMIQKKDLVMKKDQIFMKMEMTNEKNEKLREKFEKKTEKENSSENK